MSIHMTILFALLTIQMVALTFLVLPLHYKIRRPLLNVYIKISESKEFRTVYYITNGLVSLLFIDSLNKVIKLKSENGALQSTYNLNSDKIARVFFHQRNIYISGIILFLSIAIPTVFQIIRRLVKYQELKIEKEKPQDPSELKEELERVTKNVEAFRKQKAGLEKQFQELTYRSEKTTSDKKSD